LGLSSGSELVAPSVTTTRAYTRVVVDERELDYAELLV
jgi:hypothetical protein